MSVTLEFGHVNISEELTGLKGDLEMLGFNVPGSPGRSPGPTLRVRAGDTLKILLKNKMPPEQVNTASKTKNGYRDLSVVNLHTHGLHSSNGLHARPSFPTCLSPTIQKSCTPPQAWTPGAISSGATAPA